MPHDLFTDAIAASHDRGELSLEAQVTYRFPRLAALVGVAMVLGGAVLAGVSAQEWRPFGAEPVEVSGALATDHVGQWLSTDHDVTLGAVSTGVLKPAKRAGARDAAGRAAG